MVELCLGFSPGLRALVKVLNVLVTVFLGLLRAINNWSVMLYDSRRGLLYILVLNWTLKLSSTPCFTGMLE